MENSNGLYAQAQFTEKRKYTRLPCSAPIEYAFQDRTYRNLSRDISVNGIFIETWYSFSRGQTITLTLPVSDTRQNITLQGKIVRVNQHGIGVKFI